MFVSGDQELLHQLQTQGPRAAFPLPSRLALPLAATHPTPASACISLSGLLPPLG